MVAMLHAQVLVRVVVAVLALLNAPRIVVAHAEVVAKEDVLVHVTPVAMGIANNT